MVQDFSFHDSVLDVFLSVTQGPHQRFVLERVMSMFPKNSNLYIKYVIAICGIIDIIIIMTLFCCCKQGSR